MGRVCFQKAGLKIFTYTFLAALSGRATYVGSLVIFFRTFDCFCFVVAMC